MPPTPSSGTQPGPRRQPRRRPCRDAAKSGAIRRGLLLPDLEDQITSALAQVEDVLLVAVAWKDDDLLPRYPEPSAGPSALACLRRLTNAIAPTQGEGATASHCVRFLAPRGRYEHLPLRLALVSPDDVTTLADTVAMLADEHAAAHFRLALEESARRVYGACISQALPALVSTATHLAALIGLPPDRDTLYLSALLRHARSGDIVLSLAGEAAYQRYATRVCTAWSPGDPLQRWLF